MRCDWRRLQEPICMSHPILEPPSVLILTKDEEINIQACLACFDFTDDVVVFDSLSTDRTLEIARKFPNVRIIQHDAVEVLEDRQRTRQVLEDLQAEDGVVGPG